MGCRARAAARSPPPCPRSWCRPAPAPAPPAVLPAAPTGQPYGCKSKTSMAFMLVHMVNVQLFTSGNHQSSIFSDFILCQPKWTVTCVFRYTYTLICFTIIELHDDHQCKCPVPARSSPPAPAPAPPSPPARPQSPSPATAFNDSMYYRMNVIN